MAFILTSYLDLYDKDDYGNRIPKNFGNENSILDNIKNNVKKYDKLYFVIYKISLCIDLWITNTILSIP